MATLNEQLQKAKKLDPKNLTDALFNIIKKIEKELVNINVKEQLLESIDSEGKKLFSKKYKRGVYSRLTEHLSGGRKKAGTPYTLEDTGNFFKGFYIEIYENKAFFSSKDSKTALLVADFGEIFGLTDKNLKEVITSKILPLFQNYIRQSLDL